MASRTNYMDAYAINKDTVNVGPGSHYIESSIGRNSPQISMKSRPFVIEKQRAPGPGAYDVKSPMGAAKKISIAGRPQKRGLLVLDHGM